MRWAEPVIFFFSLVCSVLSTESTEEASLTIKARSSVYNVGEKKAIYCQGSHVEEPLEWYSPSGNQVEGKSTRNTRVYVEKRNSEPDMMALIIHSTKLKDSGNWTCKSGELIETIHIVVGEKVIMAVESERLVADEGRTVKLNCEAKGIPQPVVQWYMDSVPIADDDSTKYILRKKDDNYTLEIKNLTHADTAEYVCKASQKALSHYNVKTIKLTVRHKPMLFNPETGEVYVPESVSKSRMEEVFAVLNETKNITCNAIANPPPTFYWFRRVNNFDKPIRDEDMTILGDNGVSSTLILRMRDENDKGQYKCTASNDKGQVSVIFDVTPGQKPYAPNEITLQAANATHLVFNVTCTNCSTMAKGEFTQMDPDNLPIDGYSFQLARYREDYIPDWDQGQEFVVDIIDVKDTLFSVGMLENKTRYHVRVRARNAAGFSDWLNMEESASTTDQAVRLIATLAVVFAALMATFCY